MSNYAADFKRLWSNERNVELFLRNFFSLGFFAISVYRFFNYLKRHRIPYMPFGFLIGKLTEILCGFQIPVTCEIGPGLRIHHFGGIFLHPSIKIGKNATLYNGITIGLKKDEEKQGPIIGDNVYIGAGARVLGTIKIGNNVTIGANAVVLKDIPDNSLAVGVPAHILPKEPSPL